ncbi:BZ3500_MvSof-1268-A1-R1_Chr1-3g02483 [Microbotryum saponariae]|uniref:Peroxidase n=1 Tax=Microbotryum saponariae TaxID=289078 RepID=A0A2X0KQX5_9BASI|nr:BZ3500_MvSof-1268-A1-R1_Chr1-3g02483 [Microbotryum saponariae]SCZ96359.1 BZ3501_MvSof-1269-A2-R1_Chr1-3g02086 [Microbotryum saponariae]
MSSATWPQPPQATLDDARAFKPFLETLVIAYFSQVFILGMITAKAVTYFSRGSRDPTIVKVCVASSVLILWCKSGLDFKTIWNSAFFLSYRHLERALPWSLLTSLIISQIPVALSQVYLCYRLWSISKKHFLSNAIAMAGTLCSTILFIIYAILRVKYPIPTERQDRAHAWVPPWAFCTCFTDIYLSLTSAFYLLRTRKKAVGDQLDYMLLRLASLSITTCLPPALMSAIMAILEITKSTGEAWAFFTIIIASVYTLCILHSLNSRQEILEEARSRSTMKNPSPLTPGPSRVQAPAQRLTNSKAVGLTQLYYLKSKPSSQLPNQPLGRNDGPRTSESLDGNGSPVGRKLLSDRVRGPSPSVAAGCATHEIAGWLSRSGSGQCGGRRSITIRFASPTERRQSRRKRRLGVARNLLERIKTHFPEIKYSDLWTLARVYAIQKMGGPKIPWRAGRKDRKDGNVENCTPDADKGSEDHLRHRLHSADNPRPSLDHFDHDILPGVDRGERARNRLRLCQLQDPILRKALEVLVQQGKCQAFRGVGEAGDDFKFALLHLPDVDSRPFSRQQVTKPSSSMDNGVHARMIARK